MDKREFEEDVDGTGACGAACSAACGIDEALGTTTDATDTFEDGIGSAARVVMGGMETVVEVGSESCVTAVGGGEDNDEEEGDATG